MKPLLQIIHVSDLHIASGALNGQLPPVADLLAKITAPIPAVGPFVRQGMDPHDPSAKSAIEEFLKKVTSPSNGWVGPTWLLDTGDLTTFGDEDSLAVGRRLLSRLGRYCTRTLSLHGNHDAWPQDFPIASRPTIETHRQHLRTSHYPEEWPETPQSFDPPRSPIRIELYALNSVEHYPELNIPALGRVRHDRYWELTPPSPAAGHSLSRLQEQVPNSTGKTLRLLAIHHPIAKVDFWPHHSLLNRKEVSGRIENPNAFQVVLSGHTHALFPRHGRLQASLTSGLHHPLGPNQVQLVVGSMMQRDFSENSNSELERDRWSHQVQVLRIFHDEDSDEVVVARFLAGRNPGVDDAFEIRPLPGTSGTSHEEIRFSAEDL